LVTGGTGFIGSHFCRRVLAAGDRLIVLTRDEAHAAKLLGPRCRTVRSLEQIDADERIDVVVNLAGPRILAGWWTAERRRVLLDSRLAVTNAVVALIGRLRRKPSVLVSSSAIGYYGVRGDEEITEANRGRPIFQSHLCQTWELAAQAARNHDVRVSRLRFGIVLGRDGGALPGMARSARLRMKVVLGSGEQWLSWIHIEDVLRLMELCIARADLDGAFNATSPKPLRQRDFARVLSEHFGMALPLRVPEKVLRWSLGEMAQLLADGQRVLPARAESAGFEFKFPDLAAALRDLYP
jgi:uncharacterized protein (TIGR01777 family)